MRITCIQHVAFEGPAYLASWARRRGHRLALRQAWHSRFTDRPEGVILLGGPMSVHDEARLPWLAREKRWIECCLSDGVPVLGICLGAQLLAEALGGRVRRGAEREIGWHPVHPAPEALGRYPGFEGPLMPLHWHGETFDPPSDALRLAGSECYPDQAFLWGERTLALQFHLEATPEWLAGLCASSSDTEGGGRWVQDPDSMMRPGPHWAAAQGRLTAMLDELFQQNSRASRVGAA